MDTPPPVSARALARGRYEYGWDFTELTRMTYAAIMGVFEQGRTPLAVRRVALQLAQDEVFDQLAENSVSWVGDPLKGRVSAVDDDGGFAS